MLRGVLEPPGSGVPTVLVRVGVAWDGGQLSMGTAWLELQSPVWGLSLGWNSAFLYAASPSSPVKAIGNSHFHWASQCLLSTHLLV